MRIVAIESVGPGMRARRIRLDDGSVRTTAASVVKALELQVGDVVSDLEDSLREHEPELARARALALLGYRDRSVAELNQKLGDDGFPPGVVDEVVSAYLRVGLLDDRRYAAQFVDAKSAAGYGRARIRRELTGSRGIEASIADAALETLGSDEDQLAAARRALRGAAPSDRRSYERLLRRLVTKGFEFGVAKRALEVETSFDDAHEEPFGFE